jgi:ABC-type nitrate/sulfonate/bicarbonate transport system ATPase subunit
MRGDAALELCITEKVFGTQPVLRDVGFTAGQGEILALFGPSGAGKSTTLRITLGLDHEFVGHVRRPDCRLGVMFQEPRLLPWLSVAENLRLVVREDVSDEKIAALLAGVGLSTTAGALLPGKLSLGMARRTALARALVVDPGFLVLDEPFASLDPQLTAQLGGVVARRARENAVTVLLATHELEQALAIADRILVLSGFPATLQADIVVPDRQDTAAIEALRRALPARFPFLESNSGR